MQLVTSEIRDSAATALQAVKLLAQYLSGAKPKVSTGRGQGRGSFCMHGARHACQHR